jgi:hypothetical protein
MSHRFKSDHLAILKVDTQDGIANCVLYQKPSTSSKERDKRSYLQPGGPPSQ